MKHPGRQTTRSENLLLQNLVSKRESLEVIVVHHFIDTPHYLQLEVERRSSVLGIKFERIVL